MIRAAAAKHRLIRNEDGVTVVEFAMIAPVLGLILLASFDIAHTLYARASLQGIVQKIGRDATLESGSESAVQQALDEKVKAQVRQLASHADITIKRRFYKSFNEAAEARAEPWTDTNRNGVCDGTEPYQDANGNGAWDRDGGTEGQGGAKDATYYTVDVSYPRMFPLYNVIGVSPTTKLTATTILRNQPYGDQNTDTDNTVRNCPAAILAPIPPAGAPAPSPTPKATYTPAPRPTSTAPSCNLGVLGICLL